MMKPITERCPFRPGTASRLVFLALSKNSALTTSEICRTTKLAAVKVNGILAAMRNVFHNAGLRRNGVALIQKGETYHLKSVAIEPKARRKQRGVTKKRGS